MSAITLEDARRIVADTGFGPWWGYIVEEIGDGRAVVTLPARLEFERPGGLLHGSCAMGLADTTFWLALMSVLGEEHMAVTVEMKTQFIRGARGMLRCEGTVINTGRRIVYGEARTSETSGRLVAHHTLTYMRP